MKNLPPLAKSSDPRWEDVRQHWNSLTVLQKEEYVRELDLPYSYLLEFDSLPLSQRLSITRKFSNQPTKL